MSVFKEVADIQTADMLNLPVPKANYETVVCKPSEMQKDMVSSLADRADAVRSGAVDPSVDNMLLITNDGRKLALDQRLLNPMLPDFEGSKVNVCAGNIYRIWEDTKEQRLTQLVFCDLSTPGKNRPVEMEEKEEGTFAMTDFQNVYDDLRNKLIARGIPEEEIAFVHDATNEAQKKNCSPKYAGAKSVFCLVLLSKWGLVRTYRINSLLCMIWIARGVPAIWSSEAGGLSGKATKIPKYRFTAMLQRGRLTAIFIRWWRTNSDLFHRYLPPNLPPVLCRRSTTRCCPTTRLRRWLPATP